MRIRVFCAAVVAGSLLAGSSVVATAFAAGTVHVSGVIMNPEGAGINGATVTAVSAINPGVTFSAITPAPGGASGSYGLDVSPGTYDLHFDPASGSGYQPTTLNSLSIQTDQVYNVALAQTQAPSRNVRVYWTPGLLGTFNITPLDGGTVLGQSAADGHWIVTPGRYKISALNDGHTSLPDLQPIVDTTNGDVTLHLTLSTAFASVRLVDQNGATIPNALYNTDQGSGSTPVSYDAGSGPVAVATGATNSGTMDTGPNGLPALRVLNGVQYHQICGSAAGYNATCQNIAFTGGEQVAVTLTTTAIPPSSSTLSVLLDTGSGSQLATASVVSATTGTTYPQRGSDGKFSVPFGQYVASNISTSTVTITDNSPVFSATTAQSSLTATPMRSAVNVTVRDQNGTPVPNAFIITDRGAGLAQVHYVGAALDGTVNVAATATNSTSLTTGVGSLPVFNGLTYHRLCVSAPTVQNQCSDVTFTGGAPNSIVLSVTSTLPPPPTRLIGVFVTNGPAPSLAEATAVAADGTGRTYSSGVDGYIRVPAGPYTITDIGDNFSLGGTSPVVDTTNANANITVGYSSATLDVQIVDPDGSPVPQAGWYTGPGSGQTQVTYNPGTPGAVTATVPATSRGPLITGLVYGQVCASAPTLPVTCQNVTFIAGDPSVHIVFHQQRPAPGVPQDVLAPSITRIAPHLTWSAVSGAANYRIYRNGTVVATVPSNDFIDNALTASGTYTYAVSALNMSNVEGPRSSDVTVVYDPDAPVLTNVALTPSSVIPHQPSTLSADVSDLASGISRVEYYVDADPASGNGIPMTIVNGHVSATVSSSLSGVHHIGVRAVDAAGNWSNVSAVDLTVALRAPSGLSAQSPTHDVSLSWVSSPGASTYRIYRDGTVVGTADQPSFHDSDAPEGSHTYAIDAVDADSNASAQSDPATVIVDLTAPVIMYSAAPEPNANGWFSSDVTVTFSCSDALTGIASCPAPVIVAADGSGQAVAGQAVDNAGNSAAVTATINLDKTAPTISYSTSPAPNGQGWNNTDVVVTFTCSDAISGAAICPEPVTMPTDGAAQTVKGTTVDRAGNSSSVTATVNVDKTGPSIIISATQSPNANGWNNGDVTVSFACSDALSGTASCSSPVTIAQEGASQQVTGTATDNAGNLTTTAVFVSIERTAPTIIAVRTPANQKGWNNGNVTVTFTCGDALSGIVSCPSPITVTTEGANQTVSGQALDAAGNTATALVSNINIDRTAPIVAVVGPANGASYAIGQAPQTTCSTTDPLSGVNTPASPTVTQGPGGVYTASCAGATDNAGNAESATITYIVSPTASSLTALTNQFVSSSGAPNADGVQSSLDAKLSAAQICLYIEEVNRQTTGLHPTLTGTQATQLVYWARLLDPSC